MERTTNEALLVMDMQTGIVNRFLPEATGAAGCKERASRRAAQALAVPFPAPAPQPAIIANVNKAIAHARRKGIPVIYVVVGFRAGAPEISDNNKAFSATGYSGLTAEAAEQAMQIHPDILRGENDIVVVKRRVSAFTGSDLEVVLRSQNVRHITLTGIATSGVVLSTLREAADKDFRITVLTDCCADRDEEVHRVLTTKVFPRQAETMTVEEWGR